MLLLTLYCLQSGDQNTTEHFVKVNTSTVKYSDIATVTMETD